MRKVRRCSSVRFGLCFSFLSLIEQNEIDWRTDEKYWRIRLMSILSHREKSKRDYDNSLARDAKRVKEVPCRKERLCCNIQFINFLHENHFRIVDREDLKWHDHSPSSSLFSFPLFLCDSIFVLLSFIRSPTHSCSARAHTHTHTSTSYYDTSMAICVRPNESSEPNTRRSPLSCLCVYRRRAHTHTHAHTHFAFLCVLHRRRRRSRRRRATRSC